MFLGIYFANSLIKFLIVCDNFAPISFSLILNFPPLSLFTVMRDKRCLVSQSCDRIHCIFNSCAAQQRMPLHRRQSSCHCNCWLKVGVTGSISGTGKKTPHIIECPLLCVAPGQFSYVFSFAVLSSNPVKQVLLLSLRCRSV